MVVCTLGFAALTEGRCVPHAVLYRWLQKKNRVPHSLDCDAALSSNPMTQRDDDAFRPKFGRPRNHNSASTPRFVSRVLKAANASGKRHKPKPSQGSHRLTQFHRGAVAAQTVARATNPRARRVLIKSRLVNLKQSGSRSTQKHLQYIEREGVTKDGCQQNNATSLSGSI